jgi:hypothetical protein
MTRVRAFVAALGGVGALVVGLLVGAPAASAHTPTVLEFETMAPVSGPFVGAANPQRGLNGGGLPWMIDSATGELNADGALNVRVRGLVLADDPAVPEAQRGTNPIPAFRAVVSCLVVQNGAIAVTNVATDPAPATTDGNATIRAHVALPEHCVAPEIFVTSPTNSWFAVTGK